MKVILGIHFQNNELEKNNLSFLIPSEESVQEFDGKLSTK